MVSVLCPELDVQARTPLFCTQMSSYDPICTSAYQHFFSPKPRLHLRLTQPSCMSYISTGRAVCRWHQMTQELLLNQEKLTKFSPIQLAMVLNAIARPVELSWRCCKTMRSGIYELNWNESERCFIWTHLKSNEVDWLKWYCARCLAVRCNGLGQRKASINPAPWWSMLAAFMFGKPLLYITS